MPPIRLKFLCESSREGTVGGLRVPLETWQEGWRPWRFDLRRLWSTTLVCTPSVCTGMVKNGRTTAHSRQTLAAWCRVRHLERHCALAKLDHRMPACYQTDILGFRFRWNYGNIPAWTCCICQPSQPTVRQPGPEEHA